ncbi:pentatricopeptide repeat-containing protein At1g62914, mitochondrial-like [Phoenix dactylifera]|uniref:Pentatricopeptide repeat-containing protein At1g62914, mitochondrial-like n=1 Tax=Phoenix dactylifera TaxID=42345 RepID=A0A8B8ZFB8_PHODC|nr:pentatricopeptide repeat-containing protein At1g62914, mitochondrial-like [Phoenix dactylifera]
MLPTSVTYNTLIFAFCKIEKLTVAEHFLRQIELNGINPTVVIYATLMDAFVGAENTDLMLRKFNEMIEKAIMPNVITYSVVMKGLCKQGRLQKAIDILKDMHISVNSYTLAPLGLSFQEVYVSNPRYCLEKLKVIATLKQLSYVCFSLGSGLTPSLCELLQNNFRDWDSCSIVWDVLANVYSRLEMIHDALCVLSKMDNPNMQASISTYDSLMYNLRHTDMVWGIYKEIRARGVTHSEYTYDILIDSLCKQQRLQDAISFFQDMQGRKEVKPCIVTFNTLMSLAQLGLSFQEVHVSNPRNYSEKLKVVATLKQLSYVCFSLGSGSAPSLCELLQNNFRDSESTLSVIRACYLSCRTTRY